MEYVEKTVIVHEEVADRKLLDALAALLGPQRFNLWFGPEAEARCAGEKIVFELKNRFAVDWVRAHLQREIEQACLQIFGKTIPVDFVAKKAPLVVPSVAPLTSPLYSVVTGPGKNSMTAGGVVGPQNISASGPIGRPGRDPLAQGTGTGRRFASLHTFVEGLSNRLARRAADLAIHHSNQINPIYIFGPGSVGKTHLLEGIWSEARRCRDRKPPLYLSAEQFVSSFLASIQSGAARGGIQTFRNRFKDISLLLIDDIQQFARKEATQAELLHLFDLLRGQGVQIVLSGDRPVAELSGLRHEIRCRMEAGMACGIEQPERETSLRIFQNMVEQRQLPIGPDVCRMVASRLGIHARQLSGALNRLHAVYLGSGEPITLVVAEETLADLIRTNRRNVRLQDIDKAVCDTFGLSEEALQSKSRAKQIATPRMLAMWLARKYTRSALSEIGKYFGDRSHSTVITAQKKVDAWVDQNHPVHAEKFDIPISEAIQKIERLLQAG